MLVFKTSFGIKESANCLTASSADRPFSAKRLIQLMESFTISRTSPVAIDNEFLTNKYALE